jgi:cysteine synthase A
MNKNSLKVFENPTELATGLWPTPLIKLRSLSQNGYDVWAKLEFFNPFSRSIKDRPVWNMIKRAMEKGTLGNVLYEASSGNVSISMASLANMLGLKFRAYIPQPTPKTTEILLKLLGVEVVRTDFQTIDQEMINYVVKEAEKYGATNLNQFYNDDNFSAHFNYTAKEIEEQLRSVNRLPPKAIIAGIGTSGHIAALSKYFKERYGDDKIKIIGVVPAKGSKIPGIKRLETKPKWYFLVKVDEVIEITTEKAIEGAVQIARNDGILIGLSSGAVVKAFEEIRNKIGPGTYVLVFPDDAFKYVEKFENYLRQRGEL